MTLTEREREVAIRLCKGETIKGIAAELKLSTKTVEFHWKRLKEKTGARTYVELLLWCQARGLVAGPNPVSKQLVDLCNRLMGDCKELLEVIS